jgi:hypothetical protein
MTFRGILSGIGKTLKWSLISLLVIYGALWAINARDEDPSPEFISIEAVPMINPAPDNGYLALVGMNAPAEVDMLDYGKQWVDTNNAASTSIDIQKAKDKFDYGKLFKFKGDRELLCNPSKLPCVSLANSFASRWRKLADDNQLLLKRERRLIEFTHYEESYFPPSKESLIYPSWQPMQTRILALDLIALDAAEGHLESALAALEARIAFDRRALLGSHGLINAMVAALWLKNDYALLAEIVGGNATGLVLQKPRLTRMTELLTVEQVRNVALRMYEGSLRNSVRDFSVAFMPNLESMMGEPVNESTFEVVSKKLLTPMHQAQATQNDVALLYGLFLKRLNEYSPETSDEWAARDRSESHKAIAAELFSWRVLYNPVGKFNVFKNFPRGTAYRDELSDLAGIIRLARLQVEIVTEGVSDADIPSRISSNKDLYDIYTGKPMGKYVGERTLYFDTHRDGRQERILVKI